MTPFERLVPKRVVVLAGGESDEREVSLASGDAVSRVLTVRGHRVATVDPLHVDVSRFDWSSCDAVFLALHGKFGEDGTVQRMLEEAQVPFTGSGSMTSQLAFSKSASKERFLQSDVPTPAYALIHQSDSAAHIELQARKIGYPLAVKPDAQGSSLGVSIVRGPDELPRALTRCFHFDAYGILESAILGTEWTMGLLDDEPLPLIQIDTPNDFYDYDAKYLSNQTRYNF